jgi:hypothetical protein
MYFTELCIIYPNIKLPYLLCLVLPWNKIDCMVPSMSSKVKEVKRDGHIIQESILVGVIEAEVVTVKTIEKHSKNYIFV